MRKFLLTVAFAVLAVLGILFQVAVAALVVLIIVMIGVFHQNPINSLQDRQAAKNCSAHPEPGYYVYADGGRPASTVASAAMHRNQDSPAICFVVSRSFFSGYYAFVLVGPFLSPAAAEPTGKKFPLVGKTYLGRIDSQGQYTWVSNAPPYVEFRGLEGPLPAQ
jgi:hypothetical protein